METKKKTNQKCVCFIICFEVGLSVLRRKMTTYLQTTHELKVFFELNSLHTCRCVRCREKYGEKSIRGRIKCRTVLVSHGVAVYRTDIAVSRTTTPIMC